MKRYERAERKIMHYELGNGRTLIVQPHGSPICGQCAMAMIAGVKVDEIVNKLYLESGTTFRERDALLSEYMDDVRTVHDVDNRKAIDLSGTGILALQFGRSSNGHALAFFDGVLHDPAGRVYSSLKELRDDYKTRGHKIRVHAVTYASKRTEEVQAAGN
ncbi:MAG: hypothetical protein LC650_02355 [Actinobacteria bacterium]|nr:hypothetical protein [Actinomycetota bacterium]